MFVLFPRNVLFFFLLIGGAILGFYLYQWESDSAFRDLKSYPEAYPLLHQARPVLLVFLALIPAALSLYYCLSRILDRYVIRKFIGVFLMGMLGFILIWLLLELENRPSEFKKSDMGFSAITLYYLVQMPYVISLMAPFVLLLSCLFSLGQLSSHREIVGMIQTGRGFFRIVLPLVIFGVFVSLSVTVLSYHWTSWGMSYKDGMLDAAKHDTFTRAKNIVYSHPGSGRLWYVGLFPRDHFTGEALKNVEVTFPSSESTIGKRLKIDEASWLEDTGEWVLRGVKELVLDNPLAPEYRALTEEQIVTDWQETPSQLISGGLPASSLGVPQLKDHLVAREADKSIDKASYFTQFHSRFAKPWISLVAVLIAAPLGVVFSRRGAFGGVITALILCLLLFFCSEVSVTMGENGYLSPGLASWGPNLIFTIVALILIQRRVSGRPIYQTIKSIFTP